MNKVERILSAWEALRPHKRLAAMTPAGFREKLKPMMQIRERITVLETELGAAIVERHAADRAARKLIQCVVNSVRADVEEGEDGALYEAMGYIAKGKRKSGLTRKKSKARH